MQMQVEEFRSVADELARVLKKDVDRADSTEEFAVSETEANHLLKLMAKLTKAVANGKHRPEYETVISDGASLSGLWIQKKGTSSPGVAVYMDKREGPVVGVRARLMAPLASCLSVDLDTGEGRLSLTTSNGGRFCLTGDQLRKLLNLID